MMLNRVIIAALLVAGMAASSVQAQETRSPIAVAQQYLGLDAHNDRWELKRLLDVDPRRIPWCAAFVNRVLALSGYEGTDSLMARSFLGLGQKVRKPIRGDIVVLTRGSNPASGHVGFYWGESSEGIQVLGGNQQRGVRISHYPRSQVLGYRRLENPVNNTVLAPSNKCLPTAADWTWTSGCAAKPG